MGLTPKELAGKAMSEAQLAQFEAKKLRNRLELAEDRMFRKDNYMMKVGLLSLIAMCFVWLYDYLAPLFTWQTQPGLGVQQGVVAVVLLVCGVCSILYALL